MNATTGGHVAAAVPAAPAFAGDAAPADAAAPAAARPVAVGIAGLAAATQTERKSALAAVFAKKRAELRQGQAEKRAHEEDTLEQWSGLRIIDRVVRREKWDACMRSKQILPFAKISTSLRPGAGDQVIIGVLCAGPVMSKASNTGERFAEMALTDLAPKGLAKVTVVLVGRALEHWAAPLGAGRKQCVVGSIFGVLNPKPARRAGSVMVTFETQVIRLGASPSLRFCDARTRDGLECKAPYNAESGDGFCCTHARMSHGQRQMDRAGPRRVATAQAATVRRGALALSRAAAAPRPTAPVATTAGRSATAAPASTTASTTAATGGTAAAAPAAAVGSTAMAAPAADGAAEAAAAKRRRLADGSAEAAERLAKALEVGARDGSVELLEELLRHLEAMGLSAEVLRETSVYDVVGRLVRRADAAGQRARQMLRHWSRVLHDARQRGGGLAAGAVA